MKTKTTFIIFASIFLALVLMNFSSASSPVLNMNIVSQPSNISHDAGSFDVTFNVTYTGTSDSINVSFSSQPTSGNISIEDINNITLAQNETKVLTVKVTINERYQSGTFAGIIVGKPVDRAEQSITFSVPILESKQLSVSSSAIQEGQQETKVVIKNEGNVQLNNIQITASGDMSVSVSPETIDSLLPGESKEINVTLAERISYLDLGDNTAIITATAEDNTTASGEVTLRKSYCDVEDNGNLEITRLDINVDHGFGKDEDWFPFDEINVEVKIKNDGPEKIKDIEVEWGLYDEDEGKWIIEEDEPEFSLSDGKYKILNIDFKFDEDIDELVDDHRYIFYVRATGEDRAYDYNETCVSDSQTIDIQLENDFVILDDIRVSEDALCGSDIEVSADVWNIGTDDQEDVSVLIKNKELGIYKKVEVGDIDSLDSEKLTAILSIPKDAEQKNYTLEFIVYDEDNDIYKTDYDDDEARFYKVISVSGNCYIQPQATISANLESGGVAGDEAVVKISIINSGKEQTAFTINVSGYSSWADEASLSKNVVLLKPQESEEVTVTLKVKDDVEGEKLFLVSLTDSNGNTITQPVSLSIEEKQSFWKDLWKKGYLWIFVIANVVLIVIIITLAIKISLSKQ